MLHLVKPRNGFDGGIPRSIHHEKGNSEANRLEILNRYEILDSLPETAFDCITALAADLFHAPIALIALRDRDRLWFKSHHGLDVSEICWPHEASLSSIERRIRNKLDLGFFVRVPLYTYDGYELATLCVIDRRPRRIGERQLSHLRTLAAIAMDRFELRLSSIRADASKKPKPGEIHSSEFISRHNIACSHVASLTPRQREIMDLVLAGHRSKNIAAHLSLSQRTVENHRASIMKKTGSKSLPALTRLALCAASNEGDGIAISRALSFGTHQPRDGF